MNSTLSPRADFSERGPAMSPRAAHPPLPSIQMTGTQPLSPLTDTDQVMGNVQDAAGQHPPTQTPGEVSSPPGRLTIRIPGPTTYANALKRTFDQTKNDGEGTADKPPIHEEAATLVSSPYQKSTIFLELFKARGKIIHLTG